MNGRTNRKSRGRSSRSSSRSKSTLYERYDVNVSNASSSRGGIFSRWTNRNDDEEDYAYATSSREHIPIEEKTDAELCKLFISQRKTKLLGFLAAAVLLALSMTSGGGGDGSLSTTSAAPKKGQQERLFDLDPDSHKRSNPFAPKGHTSYMEGVLEVKKIGGKARQQQQQNLAQQEEELEAIERDNRARINRRWNPCSNTKYELERHDHEPRHGDLCRAKGGFMALYECPDGCHDTAGSSPYCANSQGQLKSKQTFGDKGGPCRVRDPNAPPEYRCDAGSVCIMGVGTPKEQFKGEGQYYDDTCNNECVIEQETWRCSSDMDCSLAGVCLPNGKCDCDPWTQGHDCSYLKFSPVDKSRLGYLNNQHSSWGGSIVQRSDGTYQMYASEILCRDPELPKRCGLGNWETHSQIVQATSQNIDGPFSRTAVVLPPEHHNPSVHISPKTGDWHLFSISGPTGPIVRMISTNEGQTWSIPMTISPRQNPGPLLKDDGSTQLFYRADGMDLPSPTCSNEGIAFHTCRSDSEPCNTPNDNPIFGHTGEDPSVFVDHRGNYHMLLNALPYKCVPKFQQGAHSWSADGINWSEPRVGAFNTTVRFTDGTSMKCERRERPQMVVDQSGKPIAMSSGVMGCPKALGDNSISGSGRFYRGADDSFTLVQLMNTV